MGAEISLSMMRSAARPSPYGFTRFRRLRRKLGSMARWIADVMSSGSWLQSITSLGGSLLRAGGDQSVRRKGLEFDRIGSGLNGDLDELLGQSEVAVMVDSGLGNNEAWPA